MQTRQLHFNQNTPQEVIRIIEAIEGNGVRYRLHYGDIETGKDWMDEYDVEGYVSRSTGITPIPILVHNKRSLGGGGILTNCIVKITTTGKNKYTVYQHPNYHAPVQTIEISKLNGYPYAVRQDGEIVARFKSIKEAEKYVSKWA